MLGGIKSVWQAVTDLPLTIVNGIRDIFIPDTNDINGKVNAFMAELKMKFSFDTDFFESVFAGESPVTDKYVDVDIPGVGTMNLKIFDTKYLIDGVTYFRPFIRGFIILLIALYNVKMMLGFIRQDAGVVTGKAVDMDTGGGKNK